MIRLTLRICDKKLYSKLKNKAKDSGRSINSEIVQAIKSYLK